MSNVFPYRGDYYPVLGQLLNEMNVAEEINKVATADDSQAKIDVGTFTSLLVLNLLGDVNIRLYRMVLPSQGTGRCSVAWVRYVERHKVRIFTFANILQH